MMYNAIGLMSGTSLDGLDICYVRFQKQAGDGWSFEICCAETLPYSAHWHQKLKTAFYKSAPELLELHSEYGFFLGEQVKNFISKNNIAALDVIASHGHTVFHDPKKGYTFQLGDGRGIKTDTHIPVVYDFRSMDVLLGGNGAPLVPIGDALLFSDHDACLNLGGFSNISFERNNGRQAFDICPVNIVLNKYAEQFGKSYDHNGTLAKSGTISTTLLNTLNDLPYYKETAPKSLGVEWVNMHIFPLLSHLKPEDALATFTQHIGIQISKAAEYFDIRNILVTGGGAHNEYLMAVLATLSKTHFTILDSQLVDYKEALIFAFMGVLRLQNVNNVLSSATGSSKDHCGGLLV